MAPGQVDQVAAFFGLLADDARAAGREEDLNKIETFSAKVGRPSDYFLNLHVRSLPFISEVVTTARFMETVNVLPRARILLIADHLDEVWRTDGPSSMRDGLAFLKRDLSAAELAACKRLLSDAVARIPLSDEPQNVGLLSRLWQRIRPTPVSDEERTLRERRRRVLEISEHL
jgi:hypothetical protein